MMLWLPPWPPGFIRDPSHASTTKRHQASVGKRGGVVQCGLHILMLFEPIACHYIKLPRTNAPNWAYMVPSVENLREHQREFLRRNRVNFGNWPFYGEVAGLEDAALRYTTRNKARGRSVTVVMGKADFYHAQQKTRKNLWRDIAVSDNMQEVFRRYDIFNRVFFGGQYGPADP